jgi:hypothetical protein
MSRQRETPMDEPSEIRMTRPDALPHEAAADPPLSLQARTPGPPGLAPKLGLAALAVVLLVVLVGVALAFSHYSRPGDHARPDAEIQQRGVP